MITNEQKNYIDKDLSYYVQTFKRFPVVLEQGMGSRVWDVTGKEYIDALAGIAVNTLGHSHPAIVKALTEQAAKLIHISNFFYSKPQALLAEKLSQISGMNRVFLTNSGAESVEGAIKFARKFGKDHGKRGVIISMKNCFHGRTMATIATGKKTMQDGFEPIPTGFIQAELNNIASVESLITDDVAGIIIEPIQGEGGIRVADPLFLKQLRELCDKNNIALIFDEVQCGMGRTGHWFAKDHYGVQPDIMTLAKGLGGGVPIGAVLVNEKVHQSIEYGSHGTTFGGNPLMSTVALAVIDTIEKERLLQQVRDNGAWFKNALQNMELVGVVEIRGMGLMVGVEFEFETKSLVEEMLKLGVIANATAGNVLRMVPPLNISRDDLRIIVNTIVEAAKNK